MNSPSPAQIGPGWDAQPGPSSRLTKARRSMWIWYLRRGSASLGRLAEIRKRSDLALPKGSSRSEDHCDLRQRRRRGTSSLGDARRHQPRGDGADSELVRCRHAFPLIGAEFHVGHGSLSLLISLYIVATGFPERSWQQSRRQLSPRYLRRRNRRRSEAPSWTAVTVCFRAAR
jgi:hypothetical protein